MMNKKDEIVSYFDGLFPDAKCFLNYTNDYELLIAVMLSAQTTDKSVNKVTALLFDKYPTLESLSLASLEDIERIIKPIGLFRNKAKNVQCIADYLLKNLNGVVVNDINELVKMKGVGVKTSNVVLAELYGVPKMAVDTHVERISKRLGIAKDQDNVTIIQNKLEKYFKDDNIIKLNHQIILFGREICSARNPKCTECKISDFCKHK